MLPCSVVFVRVWRAFFDYIVFVLVNRSMLDSPWIVVIYDDFGHLAQPIFLAGLALY